MRVMPRHLSMGMPMATRPWCPRSSHLRPWCMWTSSAPAKVHRASPSDSLVTAAPRVAPEAGAEGEVGDTSTGGSAGRSFAEEVALRRIATLHTMTRAEATTAVGTAGGGFQCRLSAKVEPLTLSLLHQVGGCAVLSCRDCLWSCRVALNCRADARRHCRCAHIVAGCHRGYRACGTTQA